MSADSEVIDIAVVNAHWNNRGDEAALRALLEGLRQIYENGRITILFKDDKSILQFPELKNVDYILAKFKAKKLDIWLSAVTWGFLGRHPLLKNSIKALKNADLIIYAPGGSVINDRFFWIKQMEYLVPFICARLYRIPMFVAAPSMGPFNTDKRLRIRRWLLKTPEITCVREAISQKYLEQIGIKENVHVTMDLAFMHNIDNAANESKLNDYKELKRFFDSHDKVVGVTITDFKWHIKLRNDKELLVRIEDTFKKYIKELERKGYAVLLIPQLFGNENDYVYLEKYRGGNVFLMNDTMDSNFQQYAISKLYAVIGMRYHSNIFAAKMGTPFLAVVYEEKMEGFLELANLKEYSIPLAEISFDMLDEKFKILEKDNEAIREKLRKKAVEWKKYAAKTIELLASMKV